MSSLTDAILQQYPGAYDHLDPKDIEQAVITQHPGAYDHLAEHIDTLNKDSDKPQSDLEKAVSFISNMYSKDPSKESNILPDIKQPETWMGGFGKSLYDQYIKPLGTVPGMAELAGGIAAGGIHDTPSAPTMKPADAIAKQFDAARAAKPDLGPEFTAVGNEPQYFKPQLPVPGANPAVVNDPNYFRIGARDIYPSEIRQGLMSETGGLGSGGGPPMEPGAIKPAKSEDLLQAQKFFKEQGKKTIPGGADDIKYDEGSDSFIPMKNGNPIGPRLTTQGEKIDPLTGKPADFMSKPPKGSGPDFKPNENPDFLDKAANLAGKFASAKLGLHIPGTAFGFHGLNEIVRDALFGGDITGMPKRAFEDLHMVLRPGKATDLLNKIPMQQLSDMVNKGGVKMDISDVDPKTLFQGSNPLTRGINALTDPKPLFRQVIPAMKAKTYGKYFDQLKGAGLEDNQAHQVAGNFVNNIFGGVTPEHLMGDSNFRKLARAVTLAPDWMASNFRLGQGIASGLKNPTDPRNRAYMNGAVNLAALYTGANIANYMSTGKLMLQNEPGKEFSIAVGKTTDDNGKEKIRYVDPFGTAADFARIPLALAHSAVSGDPGASFKLIGSMARSHANPMIGPPLDTIFNEDYAGRPLYGKTKYGRHTIGYGEEAANIGTDAADHVIPIGLSGLFDYMRGKGSLEEAGAKMSQLPLSYKMPAKGWREGDE